MKVECGGFLFTSDFDSGNLDKVEYVEPPESNKQKNYGSTSDTTLPPISNFRNIRRQKSHPDSPVTSPVHNKKYQLKRRTLYSKLKSTISAESVCGGLNQPVREFRIWTKPDCSGTPHETTFRTWFYFGISGGPPGSVIKINVMNLNRQGKLYFHGMKPVFKTVPSKEGWKRIPGKVDFRCATDGNFIITFCHTLPLEQDSMTYFAFTYPFSYTECQNMLDDIDNKVGSSLYISKNNKPPDNAVYYCRELVCYSLGGNKIELLTVTSCKGLTMERENKLPDLFPEVSKPRCHTFKNKKIVFISSRVHPGETPSSFVFNGMLHYLLGSKDSTANRLRNLFVFKLIPMLNPDGVLNGHYRADIQGLNLNRIYMVADFKHHPSIYAARTLLLHYHTFYSGTIDMSLANKNNLKKSKHNSQMKGNLSQNQIGKSLNSKKLSKDMANQIQKKTYLRKHSLHTCETITRNLNFLSSVPVVLPLMKNTNPTSESNSIQSQDGLPRPFQFPSETVQNLPMEGVKDTKSSPNLCHECKLSDFPSKKITLESDLSCNCIEPSDADDSSSFDCEARLGEGDASKLLKDVPCLKPEESGIAYYFDLHGHASKRGCFIYGNYFPDIDKMVDCMFLPKLMSINCPYFDFSACNFSAENMYSGSNSNIQSKEGSGRVSLYVLTGIIHSYTLECNYNTCRFTANQKRSKKSQKIFDVPSQVFFTPEIYQEIGESLLFSILDAVGHNPKSQINNSQFLSIQGVKEWLRQHAMALRGRCAPNYVKKCTPLPGSRSQDKISTRSMTIRRSLFSSSNRGLQRESSSSTNNLSSNASDSDFRGGITNRTTQTRTIRGTKSLLSSPVSMKKVSTLQRRHSFVHEAGNKFFRKPGAPTSKGGTA
ncbi:cytosolic carboxypeptidase-like protein 5 [Argiope bruennichi]|uniref:cytosolic carboxypeptidase-like protein 5 n=1 Tax=Argiope bruennichi TaxID=94029 RepID=UPI0024942A4D|nr:cytosolic carboxypeptidase-like protein 5 [Argiope bruennichi]